MNQRTDITINVPLRTGTFANPEPEEIKRIVVSETRLNISTLFDVIELVGTALENKEIEPFDAAASIRLLADLGEGLTESLGMAIEDNPKAYEVYPEPAEPEKVLDLSAHESSEDGCINLAKDLLAVLNNPHLPKELYTSVRNILFLMNEPHSDETIKSPEYLTDLFCSTNGGKQ